MQTIHIYKTLDKLLHAAASYFIKIARQSFQENDEFHVALSGGQSPKKLYELLSSAAYRNVIDWSKINFFFGDERYVPDNDPERNSLMIQKALFDPLKISAAQIFKINTSLSPEEAATDYFKLIATQFNSRPVQFDLVLLGLGENAHTASLFPFTSVLSESSATVKTVFLPEQKTYRITMTAPLINRAKHIAFLVYGNEKAAAVRHVLKGKTETEKYPAQLIRPEKGDVQWFLDEAAASLVQE